MACVDGADSHLGSRLAANAKAAEAKNVKHEIMPGMIKGPYGRSTTVMAQIRSHPDATSGLCQTSHTLATTRTANSIRAMPGGPKNRPRPRLSGSQAANQPNPLVTVAAIIRSRRRDPPIDLDYRAANRSIGRERLAVSSRCSSSIEKRLEVSRGRREQEDTGGTNRTREDATERLTEVFDHS